MRSIRRLGLLALAAIRALVASAAEFGSTRDRLAGAAYAALHPYGLARNSGVPWLETIPGLGREPEESLWRLLSAVELAQGLPGSRRPTRALRAAGETRHAGGGRRAGQPVAAS